MNERADGRLQELERRLAGAALRGQWQTDPNRPQNVRRGLQNQVSTEPVPSGVPHLWRWQDLVPLLDEACDALEDSHTARRSLVMTNPGLPRGTTQTLLAGFQIIRPGEMAWAHRHTMSALRFTVQGGQDVFTVVDGQTLPMEPYDLILTPSWQWHDHHNRSDKPAIWLDALDVPFVLGLNQAFYEELGAAAQDRSGEPLSGLPFLRRPDSGSARGAAPALRSYRFPWRQAREQLAALARSGADPYDGVLLEYANPDTGGPTLPTLSCRLQWLPPGFKGGRIRRTASSVQFVVEGEGRAAVGDKDFVWGRHDSFVVPNWTWTRLENVSAHEPAILFSLSDAPILDAFRLYRQETAAA